MSTNANQPPPAQSPPAQAPPAQAPREGQADHRRYERRSVLMAGQLLCEGSRAPCEVVNISVGGARLRTRGVLYQPGQALRLELEACGTLAGVAAWVRGDEVGVQFTSDPAEIAEILIGLATYG